MNIISPSLKNIYINRQFYYLAGKTTLYHPVNRILKQTQPPETPHPYSIHSLSLQQRQWIGNTLHQMIANTLLNQKKPHPSNLISPYWNSVKPILSNINKTYLVETPIPYPKHYPYAGKIDWFGEYKGKPCVIDWTTSEKPKGDAQYLYDKPLQLSAFCGAINRYYDLKIHYALIVVALSDQPAEMFEFDYDHLVGYWLQWQNRLKQFYEPSIMAYSYHEL